MDKRFHVIKDPVHGTMQFDTEENAWIKPFINHPNMQRLRHIKQLGLGDLLFPGAVHTRFNHSLGCCYVASQIANKIGLTREEKRLVMLAGLLHDIGHGPFSHAFEGLFRNHTVRHEEWTPYFLAEFGDDSVQDCLSMIMHKEKSSRLLADIVSSQLDADRLDYLLRDSHFCGVSYGTYDLRWMLHALTRIDTPAGERLGITHKGVGVTEHYLNARRLMMHNIYHNPKKLALEYWLVQLLVMMSSLVDTEFQALQSTKLGQFLMHARAFDADANNKKADFFANYFPLYKTLCDYDIFSMIRYLLESNSSHDVVEIAKRVYFRQMPEVYPINPARFAMVQVRVKQLIESGCVQSWQLAVIGVPQHSYTGDRDPILVDCDGHIDTLDNLSMMVGALSDHAEHACFLMVDHTVLSQSVVQQLLMEEKRQGHGSWA